MLRVIVQVFHDIAFHRNNPQENPWDKMRNASYIRRKIDKDGKSSINWWFFVTVEMALLCDVRIDIMNSRISIMPRKCFVSLFHINALQIPSSKPNAKTLLAIPIFSIYLQYLLCCICCRRNVITIQFSKNLLVLRVCISFHFFHSSLPSANYALIRKMSPNDTDSIEPNANYQ